MQARGLVVREMPDDDARATDIVLTSIGTKTLLTAARDHAADLRELFFSQIGPEEGKVVVRFLTRIVENVQLSSPPGATEASPD